MAVLFTTTPAVVASDTLTTVSRCREYLGLTTSDDDAQLSHLLLAASRAIEKYCDRLFLQASRTEYHSGRGQPYLNLQAYPFDTGSLISRVAADDAAITVSNTSASTVYARVSVGLAGTTLTYNYLTTAGGTPTSTSTGYTSTTTFNSLATSINAIGSGWSASVLGDYGYQQLADMKPTQGPFDVKDCPTGLRAYVCELECSHVNPDTGTMWFRSGLPCGTQNIKVVYTAGYATIPDDVQAATAALVGGLYRVSGVDQTLKSETLGDYSYTLSDLSKLAADLPTISRDAALLLQAYRRPRL